MTQLTFSLNFYWKFCFKFFILEQIIATVLFICISSMNNKRSLLRFQSTTAPTNRGWSACGCFGKCQSYWWLVPLFVSRRPLEFCLPSIKKVKAELRLCRSWKRPRLCRSLHTQGKAPSELYQFPLLSNFRSIMSRPTSLLRCSC